MWNNCHLEGCLQIAKTEDSLYYPFTVQEGDKIIWECQPILPFQMQPI